MAKALKKDATYADLCAVPENLVAEILGGELYASPRPAFPHVRAASVLGILIGGLHCPEVRLHRLARPPLRIPQVEIEAQRSVLAIGARFAAGIIPLASHQPRLLEP